MQSQFHAPDVPMGRKRARCCEMCRRRWWWWQGNKWRKKVSQFPPFFWDVCFRTDHPPPSFLSIPGAKFPSFLSSPIQSPFMKKSSGGRARATHGHSRSVQGNLINEACSFFPPVYFAGKRICRAKYFSSPTHVCACGRSSACVCAGEREIERGSRL